MNYLKLYHKIIQNAKKRNINDIIETHHIIPKSIFNSDESKRLLNEYKIESVDDEKNLIELSLREHYIVHALLVKIFLYNTNCYQRMLYAANMMSLRTKTSREYSWLKRRFSQLKREQMTGKPGIARGCKWSVERRKIGQPHLKGKTYEEIYGIEEANRLKKIRSVSRKGKQWTEEAKQRLSSVEHTEEWNKKVSLAKLGIKISDAHKQKISDYLSNPDKNPNVIQTLYKFRHMDGREIVARKWDMKHQFGCKMIHKVVSGKRHHSKGWMFVKKVKS